MLLIFNSFAIGNIEEMARFDSDFCITIDFDKKSENPARVFQTMTDLIHAFQRFDSSLIKGIDAKLEPSILLEDVETGSLKTWLSSVLNGIPDEAVKSGDWKQLIGHYLVRAKYIVLDKLNGRTEISDGKLIEDIQYELVEEAKKTDVKLLPHYEPLPLPKLIKSIEEINNSLGHLSKEDKAYFESKDNDKATFNMSLEFSASTIEELLTRESLSHESTMILKVKKPDYLSTSMWEFKHSNKSLPAKILDDSWLIQFQQRKIDIRPGDSIKATVRTIVKYGHDNNVIGTTYEVVKVLEVLPLNSSGQHNIFDS